jgi:hypothetical protein
MWVIENLKKVIRFWENIFHQIEGPELEPFPWHSHYLSVRCVKKGLTLLGSQLSGWILELGLGTEQGI